MHFRNIKIFGWRLPLIAAPSYLLYQNIIQQNNADVKMVFLGEWQRWASNPHCTEIQLTLVFGTNTFQIQVFNLKACSSPDGWLESRFLTDDLMAILSNETLIF